MKYASAIKLPLYRHDFQPLIAVKKIYYHSNSFFTAITYLQSFKNIYNPPTINQLLH